MQVFVIGPYFIAQQEISGNPELSGKKFIAHSMIAALFFCLSLTFFVMALIKFRVATKEVVTSKYKRTLFLTRVLLLSTGTCITVELCHILYRTLPLIVWIILDAHEN